jgi:virginiamycin A acetyltransferase
MKSLSQIECDRIYQKTLIKLFPGAIPDYAEAGIEGPFAAHHPITPLPASQFGAFSYSHSPLFNISRMGRYCSFAQLIQFGAAEHPTDWVGTSSFSYDPNLWKDYLDVSGRQFTPLSHPYIRHAGPIEIGHDVWIGSYAYIRGGVKIGTGAVIGNSAVVTKDVPPYAIVAGNPGRVVRMRFPENIIGRLLKLEWWRYSFADFDGLQFNDPISFIGRLEERIASGAALPYEPGIISFADLIGLSEDAPVTA